MPKSDEHIIVSFRLPRSLVERVDARVERESPKIKSRTQLIELALSDFLGSKPTRSAVAAERATST